MLNERKIRLMTKTAIYEKGKGKEDLQMNKYSCSDYVRFNMVKSFLAATIAAALIVVLIMSSELEGLLNDMLKMDIAKLGRELLVLYIVFVIFYVVFSMIFYHHRYRKASKRIRRYNQNLQKIVSISKADARARMMEEAEADAYLDDNRTQED